MAGSFDLGDYIQVPERLAAFYSSFPDGRVSSTAPIVVMIESGNVKQTYIQVTTTVWRTADDPTPCQASAWELFPGKTPYTKESEMMNAETSAVGRALWAVGIEAKRGAASLEDVRNARAAQDAPPLAPAPTPLSPEEQALEDHVQAVIQQAKDLKALDNAGTGPYWKGVIEAAGSSEGVAAGSAKAITNWVRHDVDAAEKLLTDLVRDLKADRNQPPAEIHYEPPPPAPEKPPRAPRKKPGSAVTDETQNAADAVIHAFPGTTEE